MRSRRHDFFFFQKIWNERTNAKTEQKLFDFVFAISFAFLVLVNLILVGIFPIQEKMALLEERVCSLVLQPT